MTVVVSDISEAKRIAADLLDDYSCVLERMVPEVDLPDVRKGLRSNTPWRFITKVLRDALSIEKDKRAASAYLPSRPTNVAWLAA